MVDVERNQNQKLFSNFLEKIMSLNNPFYRAIVRLQNIIITRASRNGHIIKCKVEKVGGGAHSDANWQCETI